MVLYMADIYAAIEPLQVVASSKQNRRDLQAVITASGKFINKDVDLIAWTNTLKAYGLLSRQKSRDLQKELAICTGSRQDEFIMFLREIAVTVSFDDFVNTVYKQGMVEYADQLRRERYGEELLWMGSADVPFAQDIQRYYCRMKQNVDNGVFKNARKHLKDLTYKCKSNIEQSDNPDYRQFLAEKLVALYVLMLPQHTTFDERIELLDDMNKTFHRPNALSHNNGSGCVPDIDTNSSDIVFASKMAITVAIKGDFQQAREYAEKAEHLSSFNKPSLARTLAYHDHQFIYLLEYWKTSKIENLSNNMRKGDTGLRMIIEEPDEVRYQWNRLHMLYKVLSLLGIHPNFQMTTQFPAPEQIEQAKEVLKEVKYSFDGIEVRRRMIYSLCMARANQHTDTSLAITYIEEAIKLSSDRTTFYVTETAHLRAYLKKLKWLQIQQEFVNWLCGMSAISVCKCALAVVLIAWLHCAFFS